ncbi:MAG TPA: hypothetical protein VNK04_18795 [Gemmataceae bacterium]|nr:hypothetical protein [Gemmataceae bacterium]
MICKLRTTDYGLLTLVCLLAGCHSFRAAPPASDKAVRADKEPPPALPGKHSLRVSQYVFLADFELKRELPLFQELADLRDQVHKELQLPTANTVIQVYLFEDEKRYERFMKARHPDLPRRRAFFVAQPRSVGGTEDLLVYTFWGDFLRKDLRHELTHALLHSVLKDVPLWLDEGLAEYYEAPPERMGINLAHLEHFQREGLKPNLARLEQLGQVQQMTPAEYREAWAWVHLMLRSKPEARAVLLKYLQQLRTNPAPGPLQPRLAEVFPSPEEALEKHLARLAAAHPSPTVQR